MDLHTTYCGLNLKSPLVVSASPLSEEIGNIKLMEDSGASAVVLYSLFEEQLSQEAHSIHYHTTQGTESFAEAISYFPEPDEYKLGPDEYLEHIMKAKASVNIPVIASLNAAHHGTWEDFASKIEAAGADALELNIYYIPNDFDLSGDEVEMNYVNILKAVKKKIGIPVSVKLSPYFSNLVHMAKKLDNAGANGLILFNRFYQPDIDLQALEVKSDIVLSKSYDIRLPMRWIAILKGRLKASLAATTGIHTGYDVLKLMMVGADVCMLNSILLKKGIGEIKTVQNQLVQWMEDNEYESIRQMQGSMSQLNTPNPEAFERAQYMKAITNFPV